MTWSSAQESARQQIVAAVTTWRDAVCSHDGCDGDNHTEECPVETARQDILSTHNKVQQLKAL